MLSESRLAGLLISLLISSGWLNVLAYSGVALLRVALTRGRLGATPNRSSTTGLV